MTSIDFVTVKQSAIYVAVAVGDAEIHLRRMKNFGSGEPILLDIHANLIK
jgi:hypothetical protein